MDRRLLEHSIRAVGEKMGLDYFYIIGSAAVFASIQVVDAPELNATRDVDIIPSPPEPLEAESKADQIDFLMGDGSNFEVEHGYYVQGVSMATPGFAPRDWKERVIAVRTGGFTGLCMEIHDLAISKYGIGREKDLLFNSTLAKRGWVNKQVLLSRLPEAEMDDELRQLVVARITADFT
jgi:hypothetical protein